jgi:phage regulator Rha-like protein
MKEIQSMLPDEVIMNKIYVIRGKKVMLDRDLAGLFGVETRRLKEQVKRNLSRFPENFMFELTKNELENWRKQFGSSNKEIMGLRIPPFAFTEHGVLMLANVLKSDRAIKVSIRIIEIFVQLREMLFTQKDILQKLENIERKYTDHDQKITVIFEYLNQLEQVKHEELQLKPPVVKGYGKDKNRKS